MKKNLPPSSLSIVYSVPVDLVLERIRMMILNAILLNVLVGAALFMLTRMYERRILFRRKVMLSGWKNMSSLTVKS